MHSEIKTDVSEGTRANLKWNKIKLIQFWRRMEVSTDGPDQTENKEGRKSAPLLIESAGGGWKTKMLSRTNGRAGGGEAHSRVLLRDSGGQPACSQTPRIHVSC